MIKYTAVKWCNMKLCKGLREEKKLQLTFFFSSSSSSAAGFGFAGEAGFLTVGTLGSGALISLMSSGSAVAESVSRKPSSSS